MENYMDLFNGLQTEESLFIATAMIISFLFGFLIALLLRASKIRSLKRELKAAQKLQKDAEMQFNSVQLQLEERNKELQAASREKVDLLERLEQLEGSKDTHYNDIYTLNQQLESVQSANHSYAASIEDLNEQLLSLQTQNTALQGQLDTQHLLPSTPPAATESVSLAEYDSLKTRVNSFETSLARLENENRQLRHDLSNINIPAQQPSTTTVRTIAAEPEPELGTSKTVLYDKIIVDDREHDDLVAINGISPFIAKQLNNVGVFTYEDIAAWDTARATEVTQLIEFIPGRIEKDQWVAQAKALMTSATPTPEVVSRSTSNKKDTDLKIIEGIGPKIAEVLNNGGIHTWSELASTDPGRLKDLLTEAGDRFKMHNPYTWPLQARLAAAGRWDELEQYQEELKGGREVN